MQHTAPTLWTNARLAAITGGRWLAAPVGGATAAIEVTGVSIDSRSIAPGQVFVAIPGEQFDGHEFLAQVIDAGAAMLIVSNESATRAAIAADAQAFAGVPILLVPDTTIALADMARAHRAALRNVIAVTGSAGKTTTRHLIHTVLSATFVGTQSIRSFNNHLGVPLTLLNASPDDDFVVVEVGTNHHGEIAALGEIVRPNIAVITNVGRAHLGNFADMADLAREKASLLQYIETEGEAGQSGGFAVIDATAFARGPSDAFAVALGVDHVLIGEPCCHEPALGVTDWQHTAAGVRFTTSDDLTIDLPLRGRGNVANALCAIAVGRRLGVSDEQIASALEAASPLPMRGQVTRTLDTERAVVVINDAYNANPDSMRHAIEVLAEFPPAPGGRRIAILGDMFELGDHSEREHAGIGSYLASFDSVIDIAVFIGEASRHAAATLREAGRDSAGWTDNRIHTFAQWNDALPAQIAALVQPGDVVLLKASRGMKLERLVPALESVGGHTTAAA